MAVGFKRVIMRGVRGSISMFLGFLARWPQETLTKKDSLNPKP